MNEKLGPTLKNKTLPAPHYSWLELPSPPGSRTPPSRTPARTTLPSPPSCTRPSRSYRAVPSPSPAPDCNITTSSRTSSQRGTEMEVRKTTLIYRVFLITGTPLNYLNAGYRVRAHNKMFYLENLGGYQFKETLCRNIFAFTK